MADPIDPLERPPEDDPVSMRQLVERIEHNTYVIRQWVRFFGILWVIGLVLAVLAMSTRTGSSRGFPF